MMVRTLAVTTLILVAGCGIARDAVPQQLTTVTPGVLRVAAVVPSPGFWQGSDPDKPEGGYEWDLARAIATRFDLELQVLATSFGAILDDDLEGVDLFIAQIEPSPERSEKFSFSVPYLETGLGVLVRSGTDIRDLATARGASWAVVTSTQAANRLDTVIMADDVTEVSSEITAAESVRAGLVDAALIDIASALVIAGSDATLSVTARFVTASHYSIALPLGSPNVELIDATLRALERDGSLRRFESRWLDQVFERPVSEVPVILAR
jgi:polar amino acid transport system substrate-binding protein